MEIHRKPMEFHRKPMEIHRKTMEIQTPAPEMLLPWTSTWTSMGGFEVASRRPPHCSITIQMVAAEELISRDGRLNGYLVVRN